MNKVLIIGRLGRDPEMSYTSNGKAVTKFSVATDSGYGDNKHTEWFNVVAWERLAENCAQYIRKGSTVYVEGEQRTNSWNDKQTGEKKYRAEVHARDVQFLDPKGSERERTGPDAPGDIDPDDLPF